jgi:hypothetical protein
VNSFLLTKKRLKRRKTNKRKGKTNRRYKRWMRGGAFDSEGAVSEENLLQAIDEIGDILGDDAKVLNLNIFLDKFKEDEIKAFINKEATNLKISEAITKVTDKYNEDTNNNNISQSLRLFAQIAKILSELIEEEKLTQSVPKQPGSQGGPKPAGPEDSQSSAAAAAKAGPNPAAPESSPAAAAKAGPNPAAPATKLIIVHGEGINSTQTIYTLEKPINGGSQKGGRRRR